MADRSSISARCNLASPCPLSPLSGHSQSPLPGIAGGIVRPTPPRVEIHALLGWRLDREGARSPRLALCLLEKAMAAARNRERSGAKRAPIDLVCNTGTYLA